MPTIDWGVEDDGKGPWFEAQFFGTELSCCGDRVYEGQEIRADGDGGWEGRECCNPE